ncbi:DUF1345 domain-containing protein [Winogradskya humida]|uniref:DUF1345 domain-containing protein n=1 Tax=Winogradskya humida TaxID=113566 RepID=A0ABQ3ZFV9_9ACTN|nr:DUF1345 domain-containing protein [Actinoplanes humidus]GIE17463.1 hypothetical protein Ahu01nite_005650 [Actinoplanes humidus]
MRILSAGKALISLLAGVVAGVLTALLGAPGPAPLAGLIVGAATVLAWVWVVSWPQDAAGTKALAERETGSRGTDSAILAAAVGGLAVVISAIVNANDNNAMVILSVVAVVLSWALVNTVFAFKYARSYYFETDGGIDFNQDAPPSYSDFAYLAFTVGMSYAISDTNSTSTEIRRLVLAHALLSYAFGTGILAVAINLLASLGS